MADRRFPSLIFIALAASLTLCGCLMQPTEPPAQQQNETLPGNGTVLNISVQNVTTIPGSGQNATNATNNATNETPENGGGPGQPPYSDGTPIALNQSTQFPLVLPPNHTFENVSKQNFSLPQIEEDIYRLVNLERTSRGLPPLSWDAGLASEARDHSESLARENTPLTEPGLFCKRPFIHHEGFDTGLYEVDRLYNRSIYDFSSAGENLFMVSTWDYAVTYSRNVPSSCPESGIQAVEDYAPQNAAAQVRADLQARLDYVADAARVNWSYIHWIGQDEVEGIIVSKWMESPGHRQNILEANYTDTGVGVAMVNDYIIVTQAFIQRVDCGYKGAECCGEGIREYCYVPWSCFSDEKCA